MSRIGGALYLAPQLHSLFAPETRVSIAYNRPRGDYSLAVKPGVGDTWSVKKSGHPKGGTNTLILWRADYAPFNMPQEPKTGRTGKRSEYPFEGIAAFDAKKYLRIENLIEANEILRLANPRQKQITTQNLSVGQLTFEGELEIRKEYLSGGAKYIANLIGAIKELSPDTPLLLVDDLGDELYPAVRKVLLPALAEKLSSNKYGKGNFGQVFASTHNMEIVKSALDHPEYCSVYMFDYDGLLVEFKPDGGSKLVNKSSGLSSSEGAQAIAKMLGNDDTDLGFPELVVLCEEESKKVFLDGLLSNSSFNNYFKKYEIQVPFQSGDGNVSRAILNLLDLSKFLFYSEIWAERYAIYVDHTNDFYDIDGTVKQSALRRHRALKAAQDNLGLNARFLLTKSREQYVGSLEETYPHELWEAYRSENSIAIATPLAWLASMGEDIKGASKASLASFMASHMTIELFKSAYPEMYELLRKRAV